MQLIRRQTAIIAEIGINHNGDLATALELISRAAEAGADRVKFQAFKADSLISKYAPGLEHTGEDFFQQMKSLEVKPEWWPLLRNRARENNLLFGVSIFDELSLAELSRVDLDFVKVASSEIDNFSLIEKMIVFRAPFVISTGMAYLNEIVELLDFLRRKKVTEIILLECTSLYPAGPEQIFLKNIPFFREFFKLETGFSDHSSDIYLALAAVALGAVLIEKHFTLDCSAPGPDHKLSADFFQLQKMVRIIRETKKALQANRKEFLLKEEEEMRRKSRRSCVALRDLKAGEVMRPEMIGFKRPGFGISLKEAHFLSGKRLKVDINKDYWISWDDLE